MNRPFWRRKANKVITYDLMGQDNDLYITNKRNDHSFQKSYIRGENIDPRFRSFENDEDSEYEDGYLIPQDGSPARKIKILKNEESDSDMESDFRGMPLAQNSRFSNRI